MNLRRAFDIICLRLRSLLGKARLERELARELSFHLEQQVQENIANGMSPDQARFAALRSLGGITQIQEDCRNMRRTNQIESIWNDLRYAIRILLRAPGFTVVIVLTMALSIGANSAIFSVIEGVLLRPLPYANPDRIVRIYFNSDIFPVFSLNPYDFRDFRDRNQTFDGVAGITRADAQLYGVGDPVMLRGFRVTAGYFHVLGVAPLQGREFTTEDESPERGRLVILSNRLWRSRFAADHDIIGRTITLNAQSFTVVGVMPPDFQHPGNDYHAVADGDTVDMWLPFTFEGDPNNRGSHYMEGFGRLKPGISPERGNAELSAVLSQLASEHLGDKGWRVMIMPLYREMVGKTQHMLLVLLGAVGLLLLIACVNAANLLLARANTRQREIAVRSALGASRGRIIRQLLTESLVIALVGAALGTLMAMGGVRALVSFLPTGFPRAAEIRLDPSVFAFTLIIAILTGLLFGLVPALTASRTDLQRSLRDGGRNATSGSQLRLRNLLVVGETGLACVLLIGAGLMLHSFVNLLRTDPGFRPQQVLTASISLPFERYRSEEQVNRFYKDMVAGLQTLPGVRFAGVGSDLPWTGYDENTGFIVEGRPADVNVNKQPTARYHAASPDYFRTLGVPLVSGRFLNDHDDKGAPAVIVVNEALAKRNWPGEDAVGKRITFVNPTEKNWVQIVGIVGDIKDQPDSEQARPAFWWPHAQQPFRDVSVVVRSDAAEATLTNQLRQNLRQLDPELALADLRFMNQIADASVANHRFALFLIGLFATLALILAAIGMYGVISYSVNQRMPEFGIRIALGARPWNLLRLIVGQGLRLFVIGAAIGLLSAAALARLLGSLLYEVSARDPITFAIVALLALVTTTLACYLPARRAMSADPMSSLRSE